MPSPDELLSQIMGQVMQAGATLQHAAAPKRYEYKLVRWEKVNDLARDGWVVQQGLGSWNPEDGHVTVFLLVKELSIADEAIDMLSQARGAA